jgi:hypothetical protein
MLKGEQGFNARCVGDQARITNGRSGGQAIALRQADLKSHANQRRDAWMLRYGTGEQSGFDDLVNPEAAVGGRIGQQSRIHCKDRLRQD